MKQGERLKWLEGFASTPRLIIGFIVAQYVVNFQVFKVQIAGPARSISSKVRHLFMKPETAGPTIIFNILKGQWNKMHLTKCRRKHLKQS